MVQRAWLSHVRHLGSFLPLPSPRHPARHRIPPRSYQRLAWVGVTSVRERVHVCLRSGRCEALVEPPRRPVFFFTCSHKHAHGSSLIIKQPTHTVDWFGSQGDVAGELDLIEFLLQVSIDPLFNISMDLAGYSAAVDTLLSGKSVVQYRDFNGASAAQSISANKCGIKDLWRLS